MHFIILASQSPRRKQLLEWAEVPFRVVAKETDESFPAAMPPEEVPLFIARKKAAVIRQLLGEGPVILAADTVVVLDERIIGKPRDREDAVSILTSLSGRQHRVITGVVITGHQKEVQFSETTEVSFHPLSASQVSYYIDTYKPYDKAGAYAIQEWIGVTGIRSINGDFYNVMGLPVSKVVQALHLF